MADIKNHEKSGQVSMARLIVVKATWDAEAHVWVAESDDLPLITEAPTVEALQAKLPGIILDLLEDENPNQDMEVPFQLIAHSLERVRVRPRAA
jgi:hypothetical protein